LRIKRRTRIDILGEKKPKLKKKKKKKKNYHPTGVPTTSPGLPPPPSQIPNIPGISDGQK
jgi:hypothetical protein